MENVTKERLQVLFIGLVLLWILLMRRQTPISFSSLPPAP